MTATAGPTCMIRRTQSSRDRYYLLPALEDLDIDVEAETDDFVIFQTSPEKAHRLARDWEVLICPPGIYGGHPEAILRVNSDGAISYHTTVYHAAAYEAAAYEVPTGEEYDEPTHYYIGYDGIEYASPS